MVPELETGNGFFGNKSFGKETAGKNHVYIHVLWQIRISKINDTSTFLVDNYKYGDAYLSDAGQNFIFDFVVHI